MKDRQNKGLGAVKQGTQKNYLHNNLMYPFCETIKGTTKMKYHIKDKDWEVIYQNLRQEKNLHTKSEKILRIFS